MTTTPEKMKKIIKVQPKKYIILKIMMIPNKLKSSDTIGFISPASCISDLCDPVEYKEKIIRVFGLIGLNVVFSKHSFDKYKYFSASDNDRASDFMDMICDKKINAVIANRGGWGCARLLPLIDYEIIKQNPKIIMGYSDVTSLLIAINQYTGLVTYHGPMGIDFYNNTSVEKFIQFFMTDTVEIKYELKQSSINNRKTKGKIIGGNLSIFTSLFGTAVFNQTDDSKYILFFEDINESAWHIDRMITQLKQSKWLNCASAIIFGQFSKSSVTDGISYKDVLMEHFCELGIPCFFDQQFGHNLTDQLIFPIGADAYVDMHCISFSMHKI